MGIRQTMCCTKGANRKTNQGRMSVSRRASFAAGIAAVRRWGDFSLKTWPGSKNLSFLQQILVNEDTHIEAQLFCLKNLTMSVTRNLDVVCIVYFQHKAKSNTCAVEFLDSYLDVFVLPWSKKASVCFHRPHLNLAIPLKGTVGNLTCFKMHLITTVQCTLGCFINDTLQKKKMQYQYAPLTGVYKPDMKEFFS